MSACYDKPLTPAKATECIRSKSGDHSEVCWTRHAKDRLRERGLIMGDILHVLKHGFVFGDGESVTQQGFFKYKMECTTPNSGGRTLCVVVIRRPGMRLK
jgi:hypothetical protein